MGLLFFVDVFYHGILILYLFVYSVSLKTYGNPVLLFYCNTKDAYTAAFFISSSIATLPIAIESARKAVVSGSTA
ncbi:cation:dicarboxylate symporter family transporter [Sporosarcina sp. GW1-11]|uniref:cation:dicarboxylate symporter family transporter n=1 Tax=Sporosarcina sp. GW1-11 TaxID=2899126 RepID=UPI0029549312|nr:cation:dicarboxylase symporter family transporter [Sporosarcina sp. GW1-11]